MTGIFMVVANYLDAIKLEKKVSSAELEGSIKSGFVIFAPLLAAAEHNIPLCENVLRSFSSDIFSNRVLAKEGSNSLETMIFSHRFQLIYSRNGKKFCSYPRSTVELNAKEKVFLSINPKSMPLDGFEVRKENGGMHLISSIQAEGFQQATLLTNLHVYGPQGALKKGDDFSWNLMFLFIATLNISCAFTLVPLLVGRIKRAQAAAKKWTAGDIKARIQDNRNDEFGDLAMSFNQLADSFEEVIKIKQDLAASDERNKLARDLHDTAKQRAFALNLQLTALKSIGNSNAQESGKIISTALVLIGSLQYDLASVIKRLSASTISEMGFRQVLVKEIGALLGKSNMQWEIDIADDINDAMQKFPQLTQQIFLIAIEAVANALRHADAHYVYIAISQERGRYLLIISDDGCGINLPIVSNTGMGLSSMRLRAHSLPNGKFSIITGSAPSSTTVHVTFDLD